MAQKASTVSGPLLIVGDFNTPSESFLFRRVWAGYADAFVSAGWGWGYTFFESRTVARIDHILSGEGWNCSRCCVGPDVGSPHRPVLDLIRDGQLPPGRRAGRLLGQVPEPVGLLRGQLPLPGRRQEGRQLGPHGRVEPGDRVTVVINPLRDGAKGGLFITATLADGKVLGDPTRASGGPINVPTAH